MASLHELRATYSDAEPDGGHVWCEAEVVITFSFSPGSADFWDRRLGCYLPGDPEEIYFIRAEQDLGGGKRMPACETLTDWASSYLDDHLEKAREEAWESLSADRADADEMRAEMRREDLAEYHGSAAE